MKKELREIELLSPAKNIECGISAVNNGADAVYIGGPGFGARKQAGNSLKDIQCLVEHAHLYDSKVYLALNTLLMDSELTAANRLIHEAYNIGVDAVIIQDMGLLQTDLPPIPIHASTQMDNRTIEKVKFLEDIGFDQVVLARELSLHQIKNIRQNTSVALEYFIHGALCVCYSGQCYMSAAINGRSANRGECAQPCRLKYSLRDKNGTILYQDKHLLSLKDLNQTPNIKDLVNAGVSSFKIEGRLKDKDYVANITAHYRKELDKVLANDSSVKRASKGISRVPFLPAPAKSFNRGFTEYFVHDRSGVVWSLDSPKAMGEKIGRIVDVKNDAFKIDTDALISNGDGLCFYNKKKELVGCQVNNVKSTWIYPNQMIGVRKGVEVHRNFDSAFQNELRKKESQREIGIYLTLFEKDKVLKLLARDDDGLESSSELRLDKVEHTRNKEKLQAQILQSLGKLGGTPFFAKQLTLNMQDVWFIPMSKINELRRQVVEAHISKRVKSYKCKQKAFVKTAHEFPVSDLSFKANITNAEAMSFYKQHGVNRLKWGFEKQMIKHGVEVMVTKHCLLYMEGKCLKQNPEFVECLPLTLFNNKDKYTLEFDCKACEMKVIKE